jgi:hypothetical protein
MFDLNLERQSDTCLGTAKSGFPGRQPEMAPAMLALEPFIVAPAALMRISGSSAGRYPRFKQHAHAGQ